MLIKDIKYDSLKNLAKGYVKKTNFAYANSELDIDNEPLKRGFNWYSTKEGYRFWKYVDNGMYEEARKIFDWGEDIKVKETLKNDEEFSITVKDLKEVFNPQPHYNNKKGSVYKIAVDRGWNAYLFDVVKRIERGGKKENNPLRQEIEKSIDVFKIWLNELPDEE